MVNQARGDLDHMAAPLLRHLGDRKLRDMEEPRDVDRHDGRVVGLGILGERFADEDAGVVDQRVDTPEPRHPIRNGTLCGAAVGNVTASVTDRTINRGVSVTITRKFIQCASLIASAGFLLVLHEVHTPATALALLCGATGAFAFNWSGYLPSYLDVAPRHGALLMGFGNTLGTIPGIVGVAVTGWLVDVTGTYSAAFVITAVVSAAGALIFGLLFDARPIVD